MKLPMKAFLLSALVAPGAGHYMLKSYKMAAALFIFAGVGLSIIVSNILSQTQYIMGKVMSGEVAPDVVSLTEFLLHNPAAQNPNIGFAYTCLIGSWLVGVSHSYLLANAQQAGDAVSSSK